MFNRLTVSPVVFHACLYLASSSRSVRLPDVLLPPQSASHALCLATLQSRLETRCSDTCTHKHSRVDYLDKPNDPVVHLLGP